MRSGSASASTDIEPAGPRYSLARTLTGHTKSVASVKYSPNGRILVSAGADVTLRLWNPHTGQELRSLVGHSKGCSDVCWSHSSRYVCSASDDRSLKLWDVETGQALRSLEAHTSFVFCCNFRPQDNLVVSGSFDETVRVWDPREGKCLRALPAHSDPVTAVEFNHDGSMIVSSSYDGLCRLWDTATGHCLKTIIDEKNPPVSHVRFSPNDKYLLTSTLDNRIRLWDYEAGRCCKTYIGHSNTKHCVQACFSTAHPRGPWVVAGSEDGSVCLWGLNSKQLVQQLEGAPAASAASGQVNLLSIPGSVSQHNGVGDGDGVAGASEANGHVVLSQEGGQAAAQAPVVAVACHPHENMLAAGALEPDCSIKVWVDTSEGA